MWKSKDVSSWLAGLVLAALLANLDCYPIRIEHGKRMSALASASIGLVKDGDSGCLMPDPVQKVYLKQSLWAWWMMMDVVAIMHTNSTNATASSNSTTSTKQKESAKKWGYVTADWFNAFDGDVRWYPPKSSKPVAYSESAVVDKLGHFYIKDCTSATIAEIDERFTSHPNKWAPDTAHWVLKGKTTEFEFASRISSGGLTVRDETDQVELMFVKYDGLETVIDIHDEFRTRYGEYANDARVPIMLVAHLGKFLFESTSPMRTWMPYVIGAVILIILICCLCFFLRSLISNILSGNKGDKGYKQMD